jgi:formylglycine-generating enzyme required for sulfatase activity
VREGEEPTRRRASRSEFTDAQWRLVSALADDPNRLLVTAAPEGGETYAEVAHEAIFRRWDTLRDWIAAEREFLAWKTGVEAARRAWEGTPDRSKNDALLMGLALSNAQGWLAARAQDIPEADREFIVRSRKAAQRRRLRAQALVGVLVMVIVAGVAARKYEQWLAETIYWLASVRGHVLAADVERGLKPGEPFRECADCPEMVVVPPGEFQMGSPEDEDGRLDDEAPRHKVVLADAFAVARFAVTFDEWDACAAHGDCDPHIDALSWGRGRQPAINVSWHDAQRYAAWLSRMTGKSYRLLSEAQWEYAARAQSATAYSFGNDPTVLGEYAWYGENSKNRAHPVGEKKPNGFGLYDMLGNVWQWVEDCYNENYEGAPTDGSAWTTGDCGRRVLRGGSWYDDPRVLRSARRIGYTPDYRFGSFGFRVARTLFTP